MHKRRERGLPITILDLRNKPHHADAVAERIWRAFWRPKGRPLQSLRDGMANFLEPATRIPFALVAELDGRICGNALVIDSDEPARPDLSPWVAALWVDQAMRRQGVAAALLREAIARGAVLGVERLYLSSRPALRDFYTRLGWRPIDENVGEARLIVYDYIMPGAPKSVPSIMRL
jgi:GNAT superfamily N-acetyltransferase